MSKAIIFLQILLTLTSSKFLPKFSPEMNNFLKQNNFLSSNESSNDSSTQETKLINVKCFWVNKYDIYTLFSLQNKKKDYEAEVSDGKIKYNFCQDLAEEINGEKVDSNMVYVFPDNTYKKLTGTFSSKGKQTPKNTWSVYNETGVNGTNITVLNLVYEHGDKFNDDPNDDRNYTMHLNIKCDLNVENIKLDFSTFNISNAVNIIKGSSKHACPINKYYILQFFMNQNPITICIICCITGFFLVIFGAKVVKLTIIVVTALAVLLLGTSLILSFKSFETEQSLLILFGVLLVIGLILGCVLLKVMKAFIIILGAGFGYTVSVFVYEAILPLIDWNPEYLYYVTIAGCAILGALIALCLVKHVLILGTSFIGAYLIIRGASIKLDNYFDESQLIELIKNEEWDQLNYFNEQYGGYVYYYLGAWVFIALIGIIIQYKSNSDKDNSHYKKM